MGRKRTIFVLDALRTKSESKTRLALGMSEKTLDKIIDGLAERPHPKSKAGSGD